MKNRIIFFVLGVAVFIVTLLVTPLWYHAAVWLLDDPYRRFDDFPVLWQVSQQLFSYGSLVGLLLVFVYDWRARNFVRTLSYFFGMTAAYGVLIVYIFSDKKLSWWIDSILYMVHFK